MQYKSGSSRCVEASHVQAPAMNSHSVLRRFFTFLLLMFLIHQMAVALFRSVGAIARNMVLANAAS